MASSAKDIQLRELKDTVSQLKTMISAFCGAQRTSMRFRADAVRHITDALKHLLL